MGGAAAAQLANLLATPVSTRLYDPSDYGAAAAFASFVGLLNIICSGRYEFAVPVADDDREALDCVFLVLALTGASAVVLGGVLAVFGSQLTATMSVPQLHPYLWLAPVALVAASGYQVMSYWANRQKAYGLVARTRFGQSIVGVVTNLGIGAVMKGPFGLLVSQALSQCAGVGSLARSAVAANGGLRPRTSWRRLRAAAAKFRQFPAFGMPACLLNQWGLVAPAVLLSALYGPATAGLFSLSLRLVGAPMGLLGQSVGQVYLAEAAARYRDDPTSLGPLFRGAVRRLVLPALGVLVLGVVGSLVLGPLLGARWHSAGPYLALLSAPSAFQMLVSPVSLTAVIVRRQRQQLALDAARAALITGSLVVPYWADWSGLGAAACYAGAQSAMYLCYLCAYWRMAHSAAALAPPPEDLLDVT
jgi:O-antigen/teichoic acid export membrane protein